MYTLSVLETHPFGDFVPKITKYLLIGSFTTKEAFDESKKEKYVWYYSNGGRNQFWPLLEQIYKTNLQTRGEMQHLLQRLEMAMVDIILACERKKHSNLDVQLTNIVYNTEGITTIVKNNNLRKIYFTSKFVERSFTRVFKELISQYPNIELVTLPSPSPRYVLMTRRQKLRSYRKLLPNLKSINQSSQPK